MYCHIHVEVEPTDVLRFISCHVVINAEDQIQGLFFVFFFPSNYHRLKTHCNRNNQHVNIVAVEQKSKTGTCGRCRFEASSRFYNSVELTVCASTIQEMEESAVLSHIQ